MFKLILAALATISITQNEAKTRRLLGDNQDAEDFYSCLVPSDLGAACPTSTGLAMAETGGATCVNAEQAFAAAAEEAVAAAAKGAVAAAVKGASVGATRQGVQAGGEVVAAEEGVAVGPGGAFVAAEESIGTGEPTHGARGTLSPPLLKGEAARQGAEAKGSKHAGGSTKRESMDLLTETRSYGGFLPESPAKKQSGCCGFKLDLFGKSAGES